MSEQLLKVYTVDFKLGTIFAAESLRGLCALTLPQNSGRDFALLLDRRAPGAQTLPVEAGETLSGRQLLAYLDGQGGPLDAPVDMEGLSDFARAVMERVRAIPFGQTRTYGRIAQEAGRPGAARAVGQVMHHNPVPLFVPCHRVLGSSGSLTGFGAGLSTKQALLELERGGRLF
ncbi:MAG: methylated-DNA--[protein]-cysteine S-methyltransferase [Pseudomonadota bacterium]